MISDDGNAVGDWVGNAVGAMTCGGSMNFWSKKNQKACAVYKYIRIWTLNLKLKDIRLSNGNIGIYSLDD